MPDPVRPLATRTAAALRTWLGVFAAMAVLIGPPAYLGFSVVRSRSAENELNTMLGGSSTGEDAVIHLLDEQAELRRIGVIRGRIRYPEGPEWNKPGIIRSLRFQVEAMDDIKMEPDWRGRLVDPLGVSLADQDVDRASLSESQRKERLQRIAELLPRLRNVFRLSCLEYGNANFRWQTTPVWSKLLEWKQLRSVGLAFVDTPGEPDSDRMQFLSSLPQLTCLTIGSTRLKPTDVRVIAGLQSVSCLWLTYCTGADLQLHRSPRLQYLISLNNAGADFDIQNCPELEFVFLELSRRDRLTMKSLPRLKALHLGLDTHTDLELSSTLDLSDLPSLSAISIELSGKSQDIDISVLHQLPSLRHLELHPDRISHETLRQVAALPDLETLILITNDSEIPIEALSEAAWLSKATVVLESKNPEPTAERLRLRYPELKVIAR